MQKGFDTEKYLKAQSKEILDRVNRFDQRLYLEFGGKLCYDYHAARVLPGYEPETKIKLFKRFSKDLELIYCVSSKDIQRGKIRSDFGLTYDQQTLKDISDLEERGLKPSCVAITIYDGEKRTDRFKKHLENLGVKTHLFTRIEGYPSNLDMVVSDKGYGAQPYIEIEKPIVVVTGTGGGSGKMFLCLSQIYNDHKKGINSGFAKFETFPIWNLPIDHPVNIAYEAATADLGDYNVIDPFHEKAYGKVVINYNRDVENFELLSEILDRILGKDRKKWYNSPTDMGVNKATAGIVDDAILQEAGKQEIIRRYFNYKKDFLRGIDSKETVERAEKIMVGAGLKPEDREVVNPARKAAKDAEKSGKGYKEIYCGAAIELNDGEKITGKNSPMLHACSAALLNAIKALSGVQDETHLIHPDVVKSVRDMKTGLLRAKGETLNLDETLIALASSTKSNPEAAKAIKKLKELRGCEIHLTHIPSNGDEAGLRKVGFNSTTDATPMVKGLEVD